MFLQVAKLTRVKKCAVTDGAGLVLDVVLVLVDHGYHFNSANRAVDVLLVAVFFAHLRATDIDGFGAFDAGQVFFFQHVEPEPAALETAIDRDFSEGYLFERGLAFGTLPSNYRYFEGSHVY